MKPLRPKIKALTDALRLAEESAAKWSAYADHPDGGETSRHVSEYIASLTMTLAEAKRQYAERLRRFDAIPVLQATFCFSDGSTRRIAVSKPTDEIEEPYIGETFYDALKKQGVVASLESYPVFVVDRRRRIINEIAVAST